MEALMPQHSYLSAAETARIHNLSPDDVRIVSSLSGPQDLPTSLSDHFAEAFDLDPLYPRALNDLDLERELNNALSSEDTREYLNRFLGRDVSMAASPGDCALFYRTLAVQLLKEADFTQHPELQPSTHLDAPYAIFSLAQSIWGHFPQLGRSESYTTATLLLRGKLPPKHTPRPWQPPLDLGDQLNLPVLATHLFKPAPGVSLFETLLNEIQAPFLYQGMQYRYPSARERKAGKVPNQYGRITLDGSALNVPAGQALDALFGAQAFDNLGKQLATAAHWDTSAQGACMYRALAEQTLIDSLYPEAKYRPGYILDFQLFNEHNKYEHLGEIRLDLINSLHAHIGGVPAVAQLAAELLLRRFAPELLIDDDPEDFYYEYDLRWANLRQGAYIQLAKQKPLNFHAAEMVTKIATDKTNSQDEPTFERAMADTLTEWAQLQGLMSGPPPWSKKQFQLVYDHYLNAWEQESLRDIPDRFELARQELRKVGIAPQGTNADNLIHLNAYLDFGAGYQNNSSLPDATQIYDREFQAWQNKAQATYEEVMQRLLQHLPETEKDRLKNTAWSCYAVTWPAYIGPIKGGIPSYANAPETDWEPETGTQGMLVYMAGDASDTVYELFPERLTWRRRVITAAQRPQWTDTLPLDYRDFNEVDIPWHISPWPKTVKLADAPVDNRLQALARIYAKSVALANRDALYTGGKGMTPQEYFLAEKSKDGLGRYLFKIFSTFIPGLGCFGVRTGAEALSCALDVVGILSTVPSIGGRIIKPLVRLSASVKVNAQAMRLGVLQAARHFKSQPIPTQLYRRGAGPKNWTGTVGPKTFAKLDEAVPSNTLKPGMKPNVLKLILEDTDDFARAWSKQFNPVVKPVFILRDPDNIDAIIEGAAYRHRVGQSANLLPRVQHAQPMLPQVPELLPAPYADAPQQGIALLLAPARNQAGTPAFGQNVSRAFESIRIEPAPITYRMNGAAEDSLAQVMVRENQLVHYTQEMVLRRGQLRPTGRTVLKALTDEEADAMGLLNRNWRYNEQVAGHPLSEHWFGLPNDMAADRVALTAHHCPPIRLERLVAGVADRRTLRAARIQYQNQEWLLVEADTGVFYGAVFNFPTWAHSQETALLRGTLTHNQFAAPAADTRLTFTRITDPTAIARYLDVSETYRIVATRPNLQQDIDNLAGLLRDWINHQRRTTPPATPDALQRALLNLEEHQYPVFARNILTSARAQDGLAGFSMADVVGLNKEIIPNFHNLSRFNAVDQLHVNSVLNRLLPATGSRVEYTPLTVAQMLTDDGMVSLRHHLTGANLSFATVTFKNGNRRVYFSLSGGKAKKNIGIDTPSSSQQPSIEYIDCRARMQGLDPDIRFTELPVLRRPNWLDYKIHHRHLDSERLIASTMNQDLLTQSDDVASIKVFTLMDTCRSCGGYVLPRLRLDYPNADFSVSWLLPYPNA
jgi:hypothetical protein